jgi:hypothetical protein
VGHDRGVAVAGNVPYSLEKSGIGAVRRFPYAATKAHQIPRLITIDPRVAFGRPAIAYTGVRAAVIDRRVDAATFE